MKYIAKLPEPDFFKAWKSKANENWEPAFNNMNSGVKKKLKQALTKEQLGICCYCESILEESNSHIEHLKPQDNSSQLELEYKNMLCSCQANQAKGSPIHCGSSKGNWYDEALMVTPLQKGCTEHFKFYGDGRIEPRNKNDNAASETISHLNLNIRKLIALRHGVISTFLSDENMSNEECCEFIEKYCSDSSRPPEYISALIDVLFDGKQPEWLIFDK